MRPTAWKWLTTVASIGALVLLLLVPIASAGVSAPKSPANAKAASEPAAQGVSWYWEDQRHQEVQDPVGNTYTIEGPNPFCPQAPGDLGAVGQTCAPGRIPVEIQGGDYDTPNKMSAVNFDFSLVPIGSKVKEFKVTFLQAKPGCYDQDKDGAPSAGDRCEETDAVNVEDHKLQACQIDDFFGNGSARPYDEAPKYKCVSSDPVAEQKEEKVKGAEHPLNDDTPDHTWTFDLTPLAQKWTSGTVQTSIMLVGAPPKDYDPENKDAQDSWRVVLAGPQANQGIVTSLTATDPPATPPPPPPTDDGSTGDLGTTGTGTDFGTGSTDFGTGSTTGGTDFGTGGTGTGTAPGVDTPGVATPQPSPIAAAAPAETNDFPMYMWLAILAGIIGFSLVRNVVIEATTGVRPNGVLAQIKSLNAQRTGAAPGEGAATGGSGVAGALGSVGEGFSSFAGKVKSIFKRG
jgi:hypothetical protein